MKFYKCAHCGNIIEMINDAGVNPVCCGEKMKELVPGEVEAATEKHVPVIEESDNKVIVKVGEVIHPMADEHFIQWIALHTDRGVQRKNLKPGDQPIAEFYIADNEIVLSSYAYCNLHGLWKKVSD